MCFEVSGQIVFLSSQVLEILKIMELTLQVVKVAVVGAIIGGMAWMVKTAVQKLQTTLENISWSVGACADKLNFVEKRLERLVQSGEESARHLCQIAVEYNAVTAGNSLKWALRQTLEIYQGWRAARFMLTQSFSKVHWSLMVESAKQWIEDECLAMEGDAEGDREARRIRDNLKLFVKYMPEYWGGAGVDAGSAMVEFARLENNDAVRGGFLDSIDEAHMWSNGCAFRSRHLMEPNLELRPHQD